ncbi:hypothetical protein DRN50_04795 [Thermococci archaeon]|nr:MAG: hypothetical protein DRN50_04795 [Thermococci archaeon]
MVRSMGMDEKALVKEADEVRSVLRNINWDFNQKVSFPPSGVKPFNCRKHHWFPATFVPEIPFTLIEVLTYPQAVVYDPFAGIGTTYFQALLLCRRPLATEICRVAIEYMQSLLVLFNPNIEHKILKEKIKNILTDFDPGKDYIGSVSATLIKKLKPWYSENVLNQLAFLFVKEANCQDNTLKSAMRISISYILKTESAQDKGWGCIADNVLPKNYQIENSKNKNALYLFEKRINNLLNDISEHLKYVPKEYKQLYQDIKEQNTIFYEDVRKCAEIPNESVDLVVTSPPYPNMTDYVKSQRLSYYFLGFDLNKDLMKEICARSKRSRKNALQDYLYDMNMSIKNISKKLKIGGYACFIMPTFTENNKNNRERKLIVDKVMKGTMEYGLFLVDEYERILPSIRRSHNIKWATLEKEKIYIFRKEG